MDNRSEYQREQEKRKRGAADYVNDLYSTYRNIRFTSIIIRAGASALAPFISGGWIAAGIGIVVIIIVVFPFFFGANPQLTTLSIGAQQGAPGTGTQPGPGGEPGQIPVPTGSRVGFSCPVAPGIVTCGSRLTPRANCGHCGLNYTDLSGLCGSDPSLPFAIDIDANALDPVYLPTINGRSVIWTNYPSGSGSSGTILIYTATDSVSGDAYWVQFHHMQAGTQISTGASGTVAGRTCASCQPGNEHLHMQVARVTTSGQQYIDAGANVCL